MPDSLRRQISRVVAGDREAISWLYETFAPGLSRRLGQRFGSGTGLERDDLLQDTFVYLLGREGQALAGYLERTPAAEQSEESFARFLWSAACGVASNRRRSLLRHPASSLPPEPGELAPTPGGEAHALARDALERLAACLMRRGEAFYLYFQLRYVDGLTPLEIVRSTGWSRKKTYKLKQALDDALEKCVADLGLLAP